MKPDYEAFKKFIDDTGLVVTGCGCCGAFYTIGLSKFGLPEMVMLGNMNPQTVLYIFNELALKWRRYGFLAGVTGDLIEDEDGNDLFMFVEEISERLPRRGALDNHMAEVEIFYEKYPDYVGENGVRIAQIMWPDKNGYFPTNEKYNHADLPQSVLSKVRYGH